MKTLLYSVYDSRARVYGPVFSAPHNVAALRMFADEVANVNSLLCKHSADFALYFVGTFDFDVGKLSALEQLVFLADATEFVTVKAEPTLIV